ncbi:TOBE domain-containing protein, partial [Klebsiella pneumoniae]|uniref:TOBE domain-containing protein n=1 Tax=Klebsiella pneumoniae TaxID=573 RepID=UPI0013D4A5F7
ATAAATAPLTRWTSEALAARNGQPVTLGVRAEDLHLDRAALPSGPVGTIRGRAFATEPLGAETLLVIEAQGVECTARLPRDVRVTPGEQVE